MGLVGQAGLVCEDWQGGSSVRGIDLSPRAPAEVAQDLLYVPRQ